MPPRIQNVNAAGTGVGAWFESLPPITRTYAASLFIVTLVWRFGFVNIMWFALSWPRVATHFEVWRLVTNFFFMGKFSFNWIIKMLWLLSYGTTLERETFAFEPADFLYMMLFGAGSMLGLSLVLLFGLGIPMFFMADSLIFMLLYVWSRQFPQQQVSIYGLFKVLAFHVPFVFVGIEFLMAGAVPYASLLGIVVGHMHYYLTVLYPAIGGPRLLVTPRFLKNLLADAGVGRRVNTHAAVGQDAFRAFGGRGNRLGAN
ncbi:hypothetical protein HYH02_001761 [Chlamydomonas schloesseri]|uniref:Derlin n=1 Tax=Chlamydomonas schloesseri TaxID=2026947 RepID=A0A835WU85_9CHLO|nr:hypothetical protein HYH02_001761 [Chlamydomonas schloesseri]|eukprot:KAG2453542.1 hypothetical protein HYH02_001761 [Chlamydomonas schloesseri]